MKQRIAHVALVVNDYDQAIAFFVGVLGFVLLDDTYQPEQDKRWVLVAPRGSTESSILLARPSNEAQRAFVGNQTGGRVTFFLETDDFWRDYNAYVAKGVDFVRPPTEAPYGTVAVFKDLYGNRWDLVERVDAASAANTAERDDRLVIPLPARENASMTTTQSAIGRQYLDDGLLQLRKLKAQADKALAQIADDQLFAALDPEANSIALIMKHMAGNMRSRWTDFLSSDGEKPDRNRDSEFELHATDTKQTILAAWEDGWSRLFGAISALTPDDLGKPVRIRGEVHTVLEAINRQLTHYAAHVGQIVLLAKHFAGPAWRSLSIPRGKSAEFDVAKSGSTYKTHNPGHGS